MEITLSDEETKQAIQLYLAMNGVTRAVTSITFTTARNTPPTTKALIELDETSVPNERIAALAKHRQDLILHTSGLPSMDSIADGQMPSDAKLKDEAWNNSSDNPANYPRTPDNPEGYVVETEPTPGPLSGPAPAAAEAELEDDSTLGNDEPAASPFTSEEVAESISEDPEPIPKESIFGGGSPAATPEAEMAETVEQIKQADTSPFDSPDTETREKPPEAAKATPDDTVSNLFG